MVVLVATLNNKNVPELVKNMNLSEVDTIVVNQSTSGRSETHLEKVEHSTIIYSDRLGLSASRNDAIAQAEDSAICQIADDDLVFVDQYESIVEKAYQEFPDADIIAFFVDHEVDKLSKTPLKKGRIFHLASMKISSVQICFKKSSLTQNKIEFDERFGIGAMYGSGEENILLFDALKKGLKIYSYPVKIATLKDRPSQWDRSNTPEVCKKRGAIYKRMSPKLYWLLILQFAIRKRKMMLPEISIIDNIKYMFEGATKFINK
ncbi:TPA: glycosyltransferase [Streptococcus suis]|uniref:glycosyltransferase n=1 Tax=Streptococcus parasuis TaxID=1501662 RepID=UPI0015563D67|nr:glycosyltransferase [Streptococcus suis]HEM6271747.1 glycosyltransferase [Streptococcus suis]